MARTKTLYSSQEEEGPNEKQRIIEENKNNIQHETKIENCYLPIEIVADILSRLTAKSIAKFRCVCKLWLSLTRDPYFLKLQHQRSSSIIFFHAWGSRNGEVSFYGLSIGDGRNPIKNSYQLKLGRTSYRFSNSVDGLTCAYAKSEFAEPGIYLSNPMTREYEKLPMTTSRTKCSYNESVGLGIDMTSGQYKVVRLFSHPVSLRAHCEIYTVGTAQWRCLGEAPFEFSNDYNPVLLHGALHWLGSLVSGNHQEAKLCIFRFNIKYETFGAAISLPYSSIPWWPLYYLKVSGGKLWLIFKNRMEDYFEIWSMEDYLHGTWVKEYKFYRSSLPIFRNDYFVVDIVDGEILLYIYRLSKWQVIRYNPRNGVAHKLVHRRKYGRFAIYRESLISPKKLLEVTQRQ